MNRKRLWVMAWFTFTRRERNGILMLSLVLLLLQSALLYRFFIRPDLRPSEPPEELKAAIPALNRGVEFQKRYDTKKPGREWKLPTAQVNPNHLQKEDWVAYGLSEGQADVVMRWREKGGVFRNNEDVRKMKFIPLSVYNNLEKWLKFEVAEKEFKQEQVDFRNQNYPKTVPVQIDLNRADTILLGELPLIGAGRARAIWKYREKLGGFYEIGQLKEIRILPDSVLAVIVPRLKIESPVYRKIDLNLVSDSLRHPYFNKTLIRLILAYRDQNGSFRQTEQLKNLPLVDEDLWRKIAPYIFISSSPNHEFPTN